MIITNSDFTRARRISEAIEEYLNQTGDTEVRSTDLYEMLRRKGLVEEDWSQGIHFCSFLKKLYDNEMIKLIPQCKPVPGSNGSMEWRFTKAGAAKPKKLKPVNSIENIEGWAKKVKAFPKKDNSTFTIQQKEIRSTYPRAYEFWTIAEKELLRDLYKVNQDYFKLSKIFLRQPHVIEGKINEMGLR